jgi:hypothetical protein
MRRGRFVWGVAILTAAVLVVAPAAFGASSVAKHPATAQGYNGTKGGTLPVVSPAYKAGGVKGAGATLGSSKVSKGGLPFTGLQLWLFALVGTALVGGGVLLKSTARQKSKSRP